MITPTKCLIIACLLVVNFTGCNKGGSTGPDPVIPDTTKPTVVITKPTAAQVFAPGSPIIFEASFSDNVKLKSYEIKVSKVVTGGLIVKNVPLSVSFSYIKDATSFNTDAKKQSITLSDINIPANNPIAIVTPGNYNFEVSCLDASDNKVSTTIVISISQ